MCFLFAPGERIDARGYWILGIMLVPYFFMIVLSLIGGEPDEPDEDDTDEV